MESSENQANPLRNSGAFGLPMEFDTERKREEEEEEPRSPPPRPKEPKQTHQRQEPHVESSSGQVGDAKEEAKEAEDNESRKARENIARQKDNQAIEEEQSKPINKGTKKQAKTDKQRAGPAKRDCHPSAWEENTQEARISQQSDLHTVRQHCSLYRFASIASILEYRA